MGACKSSLSIPLAAVVLAALTLGGCKIFGSEPDGFDRGLRYLDEGDNRRASEEFRNWVEDNPGDNVAWYNLGICYQDMGELDRAREAYSHALAAAPKDARSMVNLATVHDAQGRHVQARALLERAAETEPARAFPLYALGWHEYKFGSKGAGERFLRDALAREPKNAIANHRMAQYLVETGSPEKSFAYFDASLKSAPDDLVTLTQAGDAAFALQRWDAAVRYYEKAIGRKARAPALLNCGIALMKLEKWERAVQTLWGARDYGADKVEVAALLAQCYAALEKSEAAKAMAASK